MSVTPKKVSAQSEMGVEYEGEETAHTNEGESDRKRKENSKIGSPQTPGPKLVREERDLKEDAEEQGEYMGYGGFEDAVYKDALAAEEKKIGSGLGMPGTNEAKKGEGLGKPQTGEDEGRKDKGKETKVKWGEREAETREAGGRADEEIEWAEKRVREMEMEEEKEKGKGGGGKATTIMTQGQTEDIGGEEEAEGKMGAKTQVGEWGAEPKLLVKGVDGQKTSREVWELMLSGKLKCKTKG